MRTTLLAIGMVFLVCIVAQAQCGPGGCSVGPSFGAHFNAPIPHHTPHYGAGIHIGIPIHKPPVPSCYCPPSCHCPPPCRCSHAVPYQFRRGIARCR